MSNREAMLAKVAELEAEVAKAVAGGGEKYVDRHHARGRLLPRERIELLVDEGSAFLELSPLAGWGSDFHVGASLVTGIGVVEGVECLITANDPTVRGGASNPWSLKKALRANDIALANRLPCISLVESGGADLPSQKEIFIPGGALFRDLTRLSAAGIPTVAVVFGNSTAGGAYVPGMSDHVIMVKERSKVFLGGPPLVKMATGEESDDESLGGAEMHARVSGLADYLAQDEHDAIRIGRRIVARLNWRKYRARGFEARSARTSTTGGRPVQQLDQVALGVGDVGHPHSGLGGRPGRHPVGGAGGEQHVVRLVDIRHVEGEVSETARQRGLDGRGGLQTAHTPRPVQQLDPPA
jgi:acetyl-CoA carboxylase carboxyltransferase component